MSSGLAGHSTAPALLAARAAATPLAPAFQVETLPGHWEPVSWQDFSGRVARLAAALYTVGLRKGDRLAIIAPVSLEWELLHHAALASGVVVVGLDGHDLPDRIAAMADKVEVAAFAAVNAHVLSRLGAERLHGCRLMLHLGEVAEAPADGRWLKWGEFESLGSDASAQHQQGASPASSDIATIIFTSGTTGEPKGIAYSHGQVSLAIDAIGEAYDFVGPGSRLLCWLPLSNLFQRMVNLAGVRNGAATYLLDDPHRVMNVVATVAPDIFVAVPRFYEKLYDGIRCRIEAMRPLQRRLAQWAWQIGRRMSRRRLRGIKVPLRLTLVNAVAEQLVLKRVRSVMGGRIRCMVSGSAPMPLHLLHELHALGWLVLEAYGMSENIVPMAMNRVDDYRLGTVGRPVVGNEIRLADGGTLLVRGTGVFKGYWSGPNTTNCDADGFFITGDLGAFDADGFLTLTGRHSELIKTSTGRRIAPAPIEAALRSVPGIDQAVIFGDGLKFPVALCALGTPITDPQALNMLRRQCEVVLSTFSTLDRPRGIALLGRPLKLEENEITPNLKVRRKVIEVLHGKLLTSAYKAAIRHHTGDGLVLTTFNSDQRQTHT